MTVELKYLSCNEVNSIYFRAHRQHGIRCNLNNHRKKYYKLEQFNLLNKFNYVLGILPAFSLGQLQLCYSDRQW